MKLHPHQEKVLKQLQEQKFIAVTPSGNTIMRGTIHEPKTKSHRK